MASENRRRRVSSSVRSLLGDMGDRYDDVLRIMRRSDTAESKKGNDAATPRAAPSEAPLNRTERTPLSVSRKDFVNSPSSVAPSSSLPGSNPSLISVAAPSADTRTSGASPLVSSSHRRGQRAVQEDEPSLKLDPAAGRITNSFKQRDRMLTREFASSMEHAVRTHKASLKLARELLKNMEASLDDQLKSERAHGGSSKQQSRDFSEEKLQHHLRLALEAKDREGVLSFVFDVLDGFDKLGEGSPQGDHVSLGSRSPSS